MWSFESFAIPTAKMWRWVLFFFVADRSLGGENIEIMKSFTAQLTRPATTGLFSAFQLLRKTFFRKLPFCMPSTATFTFLINVKKFYFSSKNTKSLSMKSILRNFYHIICILQQILHISLTLKNHFFQKETFFSKENLVSYVFWKIKLFYIHSAPNLVQFNHGNFWSLKSCSRAIGN